MNLVYLSQHHMEQSVGKSRYPLACDVLSTWVYPGGFMLDDVGVAVAQALFTALGFFTHVVTPKDNGAARVGEHILQFLDTEGT